MNKDKLKKYSWLAHIALLSVLLVFFRRDITSEPETLIGYIMPILYLVLALLAFTGYMKKKDQVQLTWGVFFLLIGVMYSGSF